MALSLPRVDEMFSGDDTLSKAEKATRYDEYVDALKTVPERPVERFESPMGNFAQGKGFDFKADAPRTPLAALQNTLQNPDIIKALAPDQLASLTSALDGMKAQVPDLVKDLTTSSPIATGLVAFDLEAPAKMLTPKPTPLRNRLPRRKGIGLSHRFKQITGFTGTATGGVGVIRPGIADSTQTNFAMAGASNNIFWGRGPKITYAGADQTVSYVQFSLSDEVNWSAQFAGQGYQDIRALSRNALLWASMLMEERILLYGRGTGSGYSGILAAPTGVAGAARSAAAGEVGLSGVTTNIFVRVVAESADLGVSQATAATAAIPCSNGQVVDITYTLPPGATGARLFVSTGAADPGDGSRFLFTNTGGNVYGGRSGSGKLTVQGALPTSGTLPTAWPLTAAGGGTANLTAADGGSAVVNEYDGLLAYATGANAGYRSQINATFSTTNPGTEYQKAFASMYLAVKADPDRILMAGQDRVQLSDAVKGSANSNYQMKIMQSEVGGYTLGTIATTVLNEVTGKDVDIEVHPWLPQGNSLILSDTLPIPDTNVDTVAAVFNVQDMMGVDWPVNQFAYECSSYWFGTLVVYAPAWYGSVTNIQAV